MTMWEKFEESFRTSLTSPGAVVRWTEGAPIFTLWKIMADVGTNEPGTKARLMLEGIILKEDKTLENLAPNVKVELKSCRATTLFLWSTDFDWFMPELVLGWITTPGLHVLDARRLFIMIYDSNEPSHNDRLIGRGVTPRTSSCSGWSITRLK